MTSGRSTMFWIGIAIGALLLWFAVRSVDAADVGAALQRANMMWLPLFITLLVGFYVIKAQRWGTLLRPMATVPLPLLVRAVMIGYASNAVLPAQLGDVVRAIVASREMGLRLAPIVTTLLVERALDLLVVVALLAAIALLLPSVPDAIRAASVFVAVGCFLAIAFLYSYGRHTATWLQFVQRSARPLPARVGAKLCSLAQSGADGARALASPAAFLSVLCASFAKWLLIAGCNVISLVALGIDVPLAAGILVLACTVLALVLPSAPGYVGAIQVAYVVALKPFGVSASDAVAASLFFHVFAYGFVVVVGLYYLHVGGYRLADLKNRIQHGT